jgi:YbbR domain-containing protein
MGLWTRLQQNLSLKIVSLVAAVLLYVYVQQERNPTVSRTLLATVDYKNRQLGYEVFPEQPRVTVTVIGPRPIVEGLKDGDIKASADLVSVTSNQPDVPVRLNYEIPKTAPNVVIDTAPEFTKVQVFRQKTRKLRVEAIWKNDSPAGLRYADPVVHPSLVTVRGREDRVNRVDKIVAPASSTEPRSSIDGDFSAVAWDSERNVVEGVSIVPETVHVTIPQILEPSERTPIVSALISDQPQPPYYLSDIVVTPNQVKIIGTPRRLAMINAIYTETLSVHDLTATTIIDATLMLPPDVQVRDMNGKLITRVKVTLTISKMPTPQGPGRSLSTTPPKLDGANGP